MIFFLFTGLSGAGKSTLARALSQSLGLQVIEEREVVASLTAHTPYQRTRDWIKSAGVETVRKEAAKATIGLIKDHQGKQGIIIDGCYDPCFPDELKSVFPESRIVIVVVLADNQTRLERVIRREGTTAREAVTETEFIDSLKLAAGMTRLVERAHLQIENTKPLQEVINEIMIHFESEVRGSYGKERRF